MMDYDVQDNETGRWSSNKMAIAQHVPRATELQYMHTLLHYKLLSLLKCLLKDIVIQPKTHIVAERLILLSTHNVFKDSILGSKFCYLQSENSGLKADQFYISL